MNDIGNYTVYHLHSDYSLLDSCTNFNEYVDNAVACGQKAIASSEHGKPTGWVSKKEYCDKAGIKFMHGVEIYLTEKLDPENKVRDNYHTVLIAKNYDGVKELNTLVSKSCDSDHFYYTNRISFDEFLGISNNIISTSACLASPLNRLPEDHPMYMKLAEKYDFLEVQPHHHPDQVAYNKRLYDLSKRIGKPLIAGTDTHSSSKYKAECRSILLSAKRKNYGDEDSFDLSWKTYDELVEMFRTQEALDEESYMSAISNTNVLADMVESFDLDTSFKYPILHGSAENDSAEFKRTVDRKFKEKLESGVIPEYQREAFEKSIAEEMRVFDKLGMNGFMLSMSELICWCKENNYSIGTARGSVGGSRVAYVTDIIDLNPETWGTVFSRFCNENRVEAGDIDVDCIEEDRPAIFKYITSRFGSDKTARVASFGTIKDKGVIDDVGRALAFKWKEEHELEPDNDNPWSLKNIAKIKSEFDSLKDKDQTEFRNRYKELFYYFDGLLGTKVSQSVHPAGMIISPIDLASNYGTFDKDGETCLILDMEESHDVGLIKYDLLVLKTVQVIRDTCRYIGCHYPKTNEINFEDEDVWKSISENQQTIFQFESAFAAESLKKMKPRSIYDMSLVTACIRPSGASYRDDLLKRRIHSNPSVMIDNLLSDSFGRLVYQEQVIKFLTDICGLSPGTADSVRRGIAKKKMEILEEYLPQIVDGYCSKSDKPREVAENEVKEYLKVIEDSSYYMFGYNHSVAYCLLGYYCGYYRYYYPIEYITAYLNDAANDDDIRTGTEYASKVGIHVTMPKWGISRGDYYYDKEKNIISKGLSSIKYMSAASADELYNLSLENKYDSFMDLLYDLNHKTTIDTRQIDILVKIDFFSDFGNQNELIRITDMFFTTFKCGDAKQINKESLDGNPIEPAVRRHSNGFTKNGRESKNYILNDIRTIMRESEEIVMGSSIDDLSDSAKVRNFMDTMGYMGYVSGEETDRRKLCITDIYPLCRKSDGKQFGFSVITKSIGSGKESRFTIFNRLYNSCPINKGDIIYCTNYERDGKYFRMTGYKKIE